MKFGFDWKLGLRAKFVGTLEAEVKSIVRGILVGTIYSNKYLSLVVQ